MLKVCSFLGQSEGGPTVFPLHGPYAETLEKAASVGLLPDVAKYIEKLRPRPDAQYHLVNALGAGEYYGSNINGDFFTEACLVHAPDPWTGVPLLDKVRSKDWPYGFPTFYYAYPYAHHRNKDSSRAFGEVELALWNPEMKRVELVTRIDKDLCEKFGGVSVWDKLKMGEYPDVSMGCKVPFDTCSICLDWPEYRKGQDSYDPKKHKYEGEAVLRYHKALKAKNGKGIRGLSITRKDYCAHAREQMNQILPDGRKVFVWNDYPRFFDISFVFIGADKTAKVMMKIADSGKSFWFLSSSEVAEKLGAVDPDLEKTASVEDALKLAFLGKSAKNKRSEITKDIVPSQFAGKAVPLLTQSEADLPDSLLDMLSDHALPLGAALATPAALGIVLRPREFQRVVLIRIGMRPLADRMRERDISFPPIQAASPQAMGPEAFLPSLARLLMPLLSGRSALGPFVERRVTMVCCPEKTTGDRTKTSSHPSLLLDKIAAAYNGYRQGVMSLVENAQVLASAAAQAEDELDKIASVPVDQLFTPLSVAYLQSAFLEERL